MPPRKPLYGVSVSSSGLIYAVIVGAWAAYLVPMWLRRQDELNEARPTERFSTAIRLLSGRAAMERRYAKELRERDAEEAEPTVSPDAETDRMDSVDVRAFAAPGAHTEARILDPAHAPERAAGRPAVEHPAPDRGDPRARTAGAAPARRKSPGAARGAGGVRGATRPSRCGGRRARPSRPALPGPRPAAGAPPSSSSSSSPAARSSRRSGASASSGRPPRPR